MKTQPKPNPTQPIPRRTRYTVIYTLIKHTERNYEKFKSRSGRPGIFSNRDRRRIIKFTRINQRITYAQLRTEVEVKCSRSTLYWTLKDYSLTNWLVKNRPLLTLDIAKKRLDLKRGDLFPAGIHYWKTGSTEVTQRNGHNRGTNR